MGDVGKPQAASIIAAYLPLKRSIAGDGTLRVCLAVSGSVAAVKAAELASRLIDNSVHVDLVITRAGAHFQGVAYQGRKGWDTIEALEKKLDDTGEAMLQIFQDESTTGGGVHVKIAERNQILVIAPLCANTLASLVHDGPGTLLPMVYTAFRSLSRPVFVAPAMNTYMWYQAVTEQSLSVLRERRVFIIEPIVQTLACGDTGKGAMAKPLQIVQAILPVLFDQPLVGDDAVLPIPMAQVKRKRFSIRPPVMLLPNDGKRRVCLGTTGSESAPMVGEIARVLVDEGVLVDLVMSQVIDYQTQPAWEMIRDLEESTKLQVWQDDAEWHNFAVMGDEVVHIQLAKRNQVLAIVPLPELTLNKLIRGAADTLVSEVVRAWYYDLADPPNDNTKTIQGLVNKFGEYALKKPVIVVPDKAVREHRDLHNLVLRGVSSLGSDNTPKQIAHRVLEELVEWERRRAEARRDKKPEFEP